MQVAQRPAGRDAKVGGILGEAQVSAEAIAHVVVGVGVNLEAPEGVPAAGGIGLVDEEALLASSSPMLVDDRGVRPASRGRWRAVSQTLGRRVEATTIDGDRRVWRSTSTHGRVARRTDAGPVRVAFGDIEHLDVAGVTGGPGLQAVGPPR